MKKSILFSTKKAAQLFHIDNNQKCFLGSKSSHYMTSEGSCDTKEE